MQSVIADPIIFGKASKEEPSDMPFYERQTLVIQDSNQANYSTHQVVFSTEALSSSGKWCDFSESYISFPVYMTASVSGDDAMQFDDAGEVHAEYLLGLKSGSHSLIHSINLEYDGANVLQPNQYINMLTSYNMVSQFSTEDVRKLNASLYFNPPTDGDSWVWSPTERTSFGVGLCDNNNCPQTAGLIYGETRARVSRGNKGFLESQKAMAGPFAIPADANFNAGTSANDLLGIVSNDTQGNIYVNKSMDVGRLHCKRVMACLRLKDLHDFFAKLPLIRSAKLRLTLNINNSTFVVTKTRHGDAFNTSLLAGTGPVMSLSAPVTLANGTNPMMIASCFGTSALYSSGGACIPTAGAPIAITCSVSVGRILNQTHINAPFNGPNEVTACRWHVPSYIMTPQYVNKYISPATKRVSFEDFLCIQVPCPTTGVTQILSPSLKNVTRVVVVPHIATSSFISGPNGGTNCSQVASPFCDNFCAPLSGALTNFNIRLGGTDVLSQAGFKYGYEFYRSQMPCGNNSGLTDGFVSGLINEYNWSKGLFGYYVVDCSRKLLEMENVPQQVELTTNNVSRYPLLLYCFVCFRREVVIDLKTSAIVG
jgi:hypothetical protein